MLKNTETKTKNCPTVFSKNMQATQLQLLLQKASNRYQNKPTGMPRFSKHKPRHSTSQSIMQYLQLVHLYLFAYEKMIFVRKNPPNSSFASLSTQNFPERVLLGDTFTLSSQPFVQSIIYSMQSTIQYNNNKPSATDNVSHLHWQCRECV